jgi:phenylacetate-CoA ligase
MLATPELLQEAAQPQRLADTLSRCVSDIPLYRDRHIGAVMDLRPPAVGVPLSRWPFISKADIRREFPANFLGADTGLEDLVEREVIELEHTSGTSEERTPLLLPYGWWAEQELKALTLNASVAQVFSKNPNARRVTINSPVCSGDIRYTGVPSHDERVVGNSLFVSLSRYPFLWTDRELERIAKEVLEWRPEFLDVDPVYGVVFALYCERKGIRLPSLKFILCSYEFVSTVHRAILTRAFAVPVFDLYGSTETGHLLMEDDEGRMRPSLETAFLELVQWDAEGVGELVVSTLSNPVMPLIRYRIGDLVERAEGPYGMRYRLHGRTADAFELSDGESVTTKHIDECFAGLNGFAHYQVIQRPGEPWVLRFVPENGEPSGATLAELSNKLSPLLHTSTPILLQKTDMLVPEKSGKFRLGYPARKRG